jgi:general secretion pathway protein D
MTPRLFRVWLLAAMAGSFFSVAAQTTTPPPVAPSPSSQAAQPVPAVAGPAAAEEMVLPLKLRDAPLELILDLLETWTGRTILRPQALPTPTFTLTTKEPLPKSEALRALETLLNLNQIGLVRMGDKFLKVVPLQNVRLESPQIIEGSSLDLPPSGQIVTKLFQFQFLRVNEFLPQVAALLNQNVSQPVIFEKNNAALLTDSITTIQRVELLVEKLDQPLVSNLTPKFYNIHFAKASDVVNKLRTMLQGQIQNQLGTATSYSADDRTNQVILIADPRQLVFFDELVAKLDVKSDPNTRTEVLYLKHAASKDVATLLSSLVSGQTKATQNSGSIQPGQIVQPQPGAQPQAPAPNVPAAVTAALGDLGSSQFSSLVTVIADDRSNAVVVNGTVDDLRLIKDLVDKIDIVLAQVRIEVVITEVTLQDNATTGIDSLGLYVVGSKLVGVAGTGNGITVKGTPTTQAGFDTSFAQLAGSLSMAGNVALNSTLRKNNATVLSRPTITTTHNKEAKFFVGSTRPVINGTTSTPTGSTTGLSTSSSVTQQEIGITLTVKPLIGNDGSVQLDIKQSITDSDPANDVTIDGNAQPIINKRETDSFITIKSGEIIVLGGIVKENKGHQSNRLGPIPWIGDLLGKRTRTLSRTELIIFVRPVVLTNTPADNEAALKQIEGMPNKSAVKKELDPKYVPPETPLYKKLYQIP